MMDANLLRTRARMVDVNGVMKVTTDATKGMQLSSKAISELAKKDTIQATNIMSQLVKQNLIGTETLIKLFNGRYGLIVSNMLRTINGDILGYSKKVNDAITVSGDYKKSLNDLNNQLVMLKTNWQGIKAEMYATMKVMGDAIASRLNPELKKIGELGKSVINSTLIIGGLSTALITGIMNVGNFALAILALSHAMDLAVPRFGTLGKALSMLLFNPVIGMSLLLTSVLVTLGISAMNTAHKTQVLADQFGYLKSEIKKVGAEIEQLKAQTNALWESFHSVDLLKTAKEFGDLKSSLTGVATRYDSVKASIDGMSSAYSSYMALKESSTSADTSALAKKELLDYEAQLNVLKNKQKSTLSILDIPALGAEVLAKDLNSTKGITFYVSDVEKNKLKAQNNEILEMELKIAIKRKEINENARKSENDLFDQKVEYNNALLAFNESANATMFEQYSKLISNSQAKTAESLMATMSKYGQFGKSMVSVLKSTASTLGETLTIEKLKDSEFIGNLMNYKDVYDSMLSAKTAFETSTRESKDSAERQYSLRKTYEMYVELLNLEKANLHTKKASNTSTVELLDLTVKYKTALLEIQSLGASELQTIRDKYSETKAIYNMQFENDKENMKQKFKIASFDTKTMVDRMSFLKDELRKKEYGATLTEDEKKLYEEQKEEYKATDELLANKVKMQQTSVKFAYDEQLAITKVKDSYFTMQQTLLETLNAQTDIDELQIKRMKLTQNESDSHKKELELIIKKYKFELDLIDLKEQALRRVHGVDFALAQKTAEGYISQQGSSVGFASGGYTGNGGKNDVAGVVHSGELVIDKNTLSKNPSLIGLYEALKAGKKGYADGGLAGRISDIISRKDTSSSILDYNTYSKSTTDFTAIGLALKTLGFNPSGKTMGDSKHGFEHLYKNKTGIIIDVLLDPLKKGIADFIITGLPKATKNDKESFNKLNKHGLSATAYIEGAEKNTNSKIFTNQSDGIISNNSNNNSNKSATKTGTKSTGNSKTNNSDTSISNGISSEEVSVSEKLVKKTKELEVAVEKVNDKKKVGKELNEAESADNANQILAIELIYKKLNTKANMLNAILELTKSNANSSYDEFINLSKQTTKIETLKKFKDSMFSSDEEKFNLSQVQAQLDIDSQDEAIKKMQEKYEESKTIMKNEYFDRMTNAKTIPEKVKLVAEEVKLLTDLDKLYKKEFKTKADEKEILALEKKNALYQKQYELATKVYSNSFGALESLAKGEMPKFDMSQLKEGAIQALVGKTSFGKEITGKGYAQIGGYSLGIINEFMQTSQKSKLAEMDYESKILDMRLQGAKTEEEKLAIQQQQLQLQKDMIDAQMRQSTGFLGASGASGGMLQGVMGGLASGLATGNWIQSGIGAVAGFLGGSQAESDADRQKQMLENQFKMTEYLNRANELSEINNMYLSTMASQGNKLGLVGAKNMLDLDIKMNPNKYKLGGAGSTISERGDIFTGNRTLASYGMTNADLSTKSKVLELQSKMKAEREGLDVIKAKLQKDATDRGGAKYTSKENQALYAQTIADIKAITDMEKNIISTTSVIEKMKIPVFKSYFGAELKPVLDKDGKATTGYYADWSNMMATSFSDIYSSTSNSITSNANMITKTLFSGLSNMFVREGSKMTGIITRFTGLYDRMAVDMAKDSSSNTVERYMNDFVRLTKELKDEQQNVNDKSWEFTQLWINRGGAVSDIYESLNAGAKGIYDSMKTSLSADSYQSLLSGFGTNIGKYFTDALETKILDSSGLTTQFTSLYKTLTSSLDTLTVGSAQTLYNSISSVSVALENARAYSQAISDIFSSTSATDYYSNEVSYTTGSSKSVINNFNITTKIEPDYLFASSDEEVVGLADLLSNAMYNKLKEKYNIT